MKKLTALATALVLVLGILSGCGGAATGNEVPASTTESAGSTEPDAPDTSEFAELKMLAVVNAPSNQEWADAFWEQINGIFKEKLNCTVSFEYLMGTDARTNYDLALASGESYDLIHSGFNPGYAIPANKGAYKDLTDLIPVYAPDIWEWNSEARWNEAKVNGKIYGVPTMKTTYDADAIIYREDLRVKYDLPEVKDLDSLGTYLQGVKDNEPEMLPSDDFGAGCYGSVFIHTTPYIVVDKISESNCNFVIDPKNPRVVLNVMETPEYKEFMYRMKDWADKGYWPSSCLSNSDWGVNSVMNGKAAMSFNIMFPQGDSYPPLLERENPGWDINYLEDFLLSPEAVAYPQPAWYNMFSSSRDAKNTERGLMLLNLIQTDQALWDLCQYGVEGQNYTMTEDGKIDRSQIDPQTEQFDYFPREIIENEAFERVPADRWAEWDGHMETIMAKAASNSPLASFALDVSPVEAQYTAINQFRVELGMPLQAGLADDVDAALADYIQKVKDAGIEDCRAEIERQINAHLDSIGWDA